MKVFFSWSGQQSGRIAEAFREWLPLHVPAVTIFYSPDIEKGTIWSAILDEELKGTTVGFAFVTPENVKSEWMHFEVGAIAGKSGKTRVYVLLFNVEYQSLSAPFRRFQTTAFQEEEMMQLLRDLNGMRGEQKVDESVLRQWFGSYWRGLDEQIKRILEGEAEEIAEPKIDDTIRDIYSEFRKATGRLDAIERTMRTAVGIRLKDESVDYVEWGRRESANAAEESRAKAPEEWPARRPEDERR